MERRKQPYSIHKRPATKCRQIYYVKFRGAAGAYLKFQRSGFCSLHETDDYHTTCVCRTVRRGGTNIGSRSVASATLIC
jgi:hypothetical protein